jgi:hypothetical protein
MIILQIQRKRISLDLIAFLTELAHEKMDRSIPLEGKARSAAIALFLQWRKGNGRRSLIISGHLADRCFEKNETTPLQS